MKRLKTKEVPLYKVTIQDILECYQLIYLYFVHLGKVGKAPAGHKNAVADPKWAATEVLYMCLYGYTKKRKFTKTPNYIRWHTASPNLKRRVYDSLGKSARIYFRDKKKDLIKSGEPSDAGSVLNYVSYEFKTDDYEVQKRMQKYIDDFDLASSIDLDILKNLVRTQMMIELGQMQKLKGNANVTFDLKSLSDQLKNYTTLLGLSKKDRVDLGSERKKGSVAQLAQVYEETRKEWPELEEKFLVEELELLLSKFHRKNNDGDREISRKSFRIVSGGFTPEEALEIVKNYNDEQ